ncbi:MAG: MBL fold metallo-hydrolase [Thermoleophilia bacterium]|nr:MBL fold metallo-hydrolase [Thermoleophilia bacterium]
MVQVTRIDLGGVNCYLVPADRGFALIDTGGPGRRTVLEQALSLAGCWPGDIRVVVLTHGDYNHAGNAAYLRDKYDAKVAMHHDDLGRVRRGDWKWGQRPKPDRAVWSLRLLSLFRKKRDDFEVFEPDACLEDGQSLLRYGCDATVLRLPGHTKGSIGVLTSDKDIVCGDLLGNLFRPGLGILINDMAAAKTSLGRLRRLQVGAVYPGHGKPFRLADIRGGD